MATQEHRKKLIKAKSLEEILDALSIRECSYLLIGDGSGNRWEYPAGWACLLIEPATDWRDWFFGCFNSGTNNLAELMAYANPLMWLASRKELQRTSTGACRVHILSDSEWAVKTANGAWPRTAHKEIWALFDAFRKQGIFLHWHWIPGHEDIPANEFADRIAGASRQMALDLDPGDFLTKLGLDDVSEMYPVEDT